MKKVIERSGRGAAYGKQILATVSQGLTAESGDGFDYTALTRIARFAESMTDEAIVVTLSQQFGIVGSAGVRPA